MKFHLLAVIRRGGMTALALSCGLLAHSSPAWAEPKNVLIIRGGAANLPGGVIVVDEVEARIREQIHDPVEFYVETIDPARFTGSAYDQKLVELFTETYTRIHLDLVVAFTGPSVEFTLQHRQVLFPHAPLLLGVIERRFSRDHQMPPDASVVYVQVDTDTTIRMALATAPGVKHVVVVGGTSVFDRGWQRLVEEDLRTFESALSAETLADLPPEDLHRRIAALTPGNIVLYTVVTRDGAGLPADPVKFLEALRAVSPVPIYGLSSTHLGHGLVGGALLDFDRHADDLAEEAIRRLRGESPRTTMTEATRAVDWRELQRFHMTGAPLPAGTRVVYRESSTWDRYRWPILGFLLLLLIESALLAGLVMNLRRRRQVQQLLKRRLQIERLLSELSVRLTAVAPADIRREIDKALAKIGDGVGFGSVWLWLSGEPDDAQWNAAALRGGARMTFTDIAELPPTIQSRLRERGGLLRDATAVPLGGGGAVPGALFWVSSLPRAEWTIRSDEKSMVATVVGNVLHRRLAEGALQESDRLKGAILDSLPAHVAVLDRDGRIISVNDAWVEYARRSGDAAPDAGGVGSLYLDACASGRARGLPDSRVARALIEAACDGRSSGEQIEYPGGPAGERWFVLRAEPLRRAEGGAVVTHTDITERKRNEIALRESEDRFRRLADALPVAIWMADEDAGCSYFNLQWLQLTGRPLEQEIGDGWLRGVHPEDRDACMGQYLRAFHARQSFTMDYRLRRHDGQYRWIMDIGMPRYGSDGVFHGYVGGCIDVTDRKEAEQMLRDFNRRLLAAQEDERRRIARELHDHLNQQLALLAIHLQQLSMSLPDSTEELVEGLQQGWRRTSEIASDVHAISHRLHPSKLEALGLVATMRAHCRDVSRQSIVVHFSEQNVPPIVPVDVALCLFRVLEEALQNVVKHSGAPEADVALVGLGEEITLRVSDNGRGFGSERQAMSGIGVVSMRERLQAAGGSLTISSAPGRGTVVEARLSARTVEHPTLA